MPQAVGTVVRPVRSDELDSILHLAKASGVGFTSLPNNPELLEKKIQRSIDSLSKTEEKYREGSYLFVLEDMSTGALIGTTGLVSDVGGGEPFYHFRVSNITKACRSLNLYREHCTLTMANDYQTVSELCSLFLLPDRREHYNGQLLSRCRYLFISEFLQRFDELVIAEMRGVSDENGKCPFWEGLVHHFLDMEFYEADYLVGSGEKQFISDMMPRHPIYVSLLPEEARHVIAQVNKKTKPAIELLKREGFVYKNFIDIFDAGPTVESYVHNIRSVQQNQRSMLRAYASSDQGEEMLLSNCKLDFRACVAPILIDDEGVSVSESVAKALNIVPGEAVRYLPLDMKGKGEST